MDTYRWCMRCCTVLQDPSILYWDTPLGIGPFRVLAASYGHPRDATQAFDVRPQLQARVVSYGSGYCFRICGFICVCEYFFVELCLNIVDCLMQVLGCSFMRRLT